MNVTLRVTGLNLGKCLSAASQEGILLKRVKRLEVDAMTVCIAQRDYRAFSALCEKCGWSLSVIRRGFVLRAVDGMLKRPSLPAAALLFFALTWCSSQMLWRVEILGAGKSAGEVRMYLAENRIAPGRWRDSLSVSALREALFLRLPDLSFVGVRWEGSTLVVECRNALEGEEQQIAGDGLDLIALEDGIITWMVVQAGTPQVEIGQAVKKGDVLVKGEERGEGGTVHPVKSHGEVIARVWARGDAKVSLVQSRTVETGEYRRRVMLCTPWHRRVVRDAAAFDRQDVSVRAERIVGLYLPVWREIETLARIQVIQEERKPTDAASMAQGAALQMAKLKCPAGAEILDKWVDYSMIDNEFVCATVVLEYEHGIAGRMDRE